MAEADETLLSRAVVGDSEALAELITRNGPALERSLNGRIDAKWRSVLSVDDVLQETFADALVGIASFESRGPDSFVAWLVTLARNNLREAIRGLDAVKRGGGRQRVQTEQESYVCLFEVLGGSMTTPSGRLAFDEARDALDSAIDKLPESYREVVKLYDLAGCSVDDVCEACECSPGAMFMRRRRAHDMLQSIIGSTPHAM